MGYCEGYIKLTPLNTQYTVGAHKWLVLLWSQPTIHGPALSREVPLPGPVVLACPHPAASWHWMSLSSEHSGPSSAGKAHLYLPSLCFWKSSFRCLGLVSPSRRQEGQWCHRGTSPIPHLQTGGIKILALASGKDTMSWAGFRSSDTTRRLSLWQIWVFKRWPQGDFSVADKVRWHALVLTWGTCTYLQKDRDIVMDTSSKGWKPQSTYHIWDGNVRRLFSGQRGDFYHLLVQGRFLADILGIASASLRAAGIKAEEKEPTLRAQDHIKGGTKPRHPPKFYSKAALKEEGEQRTLIHLSLLRSRP